MATSQQRADRRTKIWVAVLGSPVLAGLISLIVVWAPWKHDAPQQNPNQPQISGNPFNQSVFVNPTSGAGGVQVRLSGEGFPAITAQSGPLVAETPFMLTG